MSTRTVRFEPVTWPSSKNLPCPECGKKVRRQKTFQMTISPFNKNPDGTVRTRPEIIIALREKAAKWAETPEHCTPCADAQPKPTRRRTRADESHQIAGTT